MSEIQSGISETESGLSETESGVSKIQYGLSEIESGVCETESGISETESGVGKIESGLSEIQFLALETESLGVKTHIILRQADLKRSGKRQVASGISHQPPSRQERQEAAKSFSLRGYLDTSGDYWLAGQRLA